MRDLCKNESFWMNRTIKRFSRFSKDIKRDCVNLNLTWKEFYIKLANITEYFYNSVFNPSKYLVFSNTHDPLFIHLFDNINNLVHINTLKLSYIIRTEKAPFKIKKYCYCCLEKKLYKRILRILKTDPRFKPKVVLKYTFQLPFPHIEIIVSQIYKLLGWQDILSELVTSLQLKSSGRSYTLIYLKYAILLGATSKDIKEAFSKDTEHKISERELEIVNRFIKTMEK